MAQVTPPPMASMAVLLVSLVYFHIDALARYSAAQADLR